MKKSVKNVVKEEEVAQVSVIDHEKDDMKEIREFIQRKKLQNKILQKITDQILENGSPLLKDLKRNAG